jgi:hypothetical protein
MRSIVKLTVLLAVLLMVANSYAQLRLESSYLTFNFGFMISELKDSGETLNSGTAALNYELLLSPQLPLAVGFGVGYLAGEEQFTSEGVPTRAEYSAWPLYFSGRYFIGKKRVVGYVGWGLGLHFGTLELFTEDDQSARSSTNISIAVPVGLYVFLSERVYLNGGYTPTWIDSSLLDGFSSVFTFGVGFQFPNR